jgi:hypothetical protein
MVQKKIVVLLSLSFLLLFSACNLPVGTAAVSGSNQNPTVDIQTQIAGIVASTAGAQTALSNAVAGTLAAMATITPEYTFTPSLTPTSSLTFTPTFTLTPAVPMVSVSVQTNCRTGPGTVYDKLGVVNVGQIAEVVGRSASSDNWIIKLPSNPAITCWLWGYYATVVGDTTRLPVIIPPPTPTPVASFNVVFISKENCVGMFGIKLQITNNGSVTWESNRVTATDNVTTESHTIDRNEFPNYNDIGCALVSSDLDLAAGEVGLTSTGTFGANPTGHNFTATIRVCSQDGLLGTCQEKTITFTP